MQARTAALILWVSAFFLFLSGCNPPAKTAPTNTSTVQPATATLPAPTALPTATATLTPYPSITPLITAPVPVEGSLPRLPAGVQVELSSFWMFNPLDGWATGGEPGNNDHILRTGDGGSTWQDLTPPELAPENGHKKAVHVFFLDTKVGWAVYSPASDFQIVAPLVWHTIDGGHSWQAGGTLDMSGLEGYFLPSDLHFIDAHTGWLLAHVGAGMNHDYVALYRSQDGGSSWQRLLDPFSNDGGIQSCTKSAMRFIDAQNGWMTGDCNGVAPGVLLFRSRDAGSSWEPVTLPEPAGESDLFTSFEVACGSYYPILWDSQTTRLVVRCMRYTVDPPRTDFFLYQTNDGGKTWQSSQYPGGMPYFYTPADGLALENEIFSSQDGGASWVQVGQLEGAKSYMFLNEEFGWALRSSEDGNLLFQTGDGGASWIQLETHTTAP